MKIRLLYVWICGYGFGLLNCGLNFVEDPAAKSVCIIVGAVAFLTSWFLDYRVFRKLKK